MLPQRRRGPDLHPKVAWPELSEVMATKAKRSDAAVAIILSPRHPHNRVCSHTCTADQSVLSLFDVRVAKKSGSFLISILSQNAVERFCNPASNALQHRRIRYKSSLSLGTDWLLSALGGVGGLRVRLKL
jgi:hypothetical protein